MKHVGRDILSMLVTSLVALGCASVRTNPPDTPKEDPQAIFHAIYDALYTGDRSVWEHWLAADFVLVDRDGTIKDKRAIVAELEPVSPKVTLHFDFEEMSERKIGEGTMLLFMVRETETIFGQTLHVDYRNSLLFAPRDGGLRLVAWQYVEIPKDAPPVAIDPVRFDDYVGTYAAADVQIVVRRDGSRLWAQRSGRPAMELIAEGDGVFYVPKTEFRKIFVRNEEGRVVEMLDRRKGTDVRWRRIP